MSTADKWKGLGDVAGDIVSGLEEITPITSVEAILRREFGPLLDAAEAAADVPAPEEIKLLCDALEKFK